MLPPGEHASVSVCPSAPFSEVAFASQVVGTPATVAAGAGAVLELFAAVLECPPPTEFVFSLFTFEQPALPSRSAASTSTTQPQIIARKNRESGSRLDWYDGVTADTPFVSSGCLLSRYARDYSILRWVHAPVVCARVV